VKDAELLPVTIQAAAAASLQYLFDRELACPPPREKEHLKRTGRTTR